MKDDKKRRKYLIILFLLMIVGISVTYSLLLSKLDIGGRGKISKNSWDIFFENIVVKEGSVNSLFDNISETGLSFDATFDLPGDYLEFYVDVVNGGSIDAMVDNFIISDISSYSNIINYDVTYSDGTLINKRDKLVSGDKNTLLIKVEYKKDISIEDLSNNDIDIDFSFEIEYVQDDGTGIVKKNLSNTFNVDKKDGSNLVLNKMLDEDEAGVYTLNDITFFRGYDLNNNVLLDNNCYKIVSYSNGAIKLLYNGKSKNGVCGLETTLISRTEFNKDLSVYDYNDSVIKTVLNDWYNANLLKYDDYIVGGYCYDLSMSNEIYNTVTRFGDGVVDFSCNNIRDKVGLLTVDDVLLMGYGTYGGVNNDSSLVEEFYLMSPYSYNNNQHNLYYITNIGDVNKINGGMELGIRPVIKIKDTVKFVDGLGTLDNPYIIDFYV